MKEYKIKVNGTNYAVTIDDLDESKATVSVNGQAYHVEVEGMAAKPRTSKIVQKAVPTSTTIPTTPTPRPASSATGEGAPVKSPLPGVVLDVLVKEGDVVKVGQKLMILEAMKMENNIESDRDGVVKSIVARKGDSVLEGDVLITIA